MAEWVGVALTVFQYRAVDKQGVERSGVLEAASRASVLHSLGERGLIPLTIRAGGGLEASAARRVVGWMRSSRPRGLNARALANFTQSLAALLTAGLTVDRALAVVATVGGATPTHAFAKNLEKSVRSGRALADAFSESGQRLPSYYVSMVRAGEVSGTLAVTLERLAELLRQQREVAEQIRSALIYPLILAAIVLITLIVLLAFVLPRFELMFAETDAVIPTSTRAVLAVGRFVSDYWWLLVMGVAALVIAGVYVWQAPAGRERLDRWLVSSRLTLALPAGLATARLMRTLGTLLSSGAPLPDAVSIASATVRNRALSRALQDVLSGVRAGQSFSTALARSALFPPLAVQLVHVGEETGRLDGLVVSAAEFLDQEAQHTIQRLLSLIVPGAVILMGGVVAALIGSVLIGLLSINDLAF